MEKSSYAPGPSNGAQNKPTVEEKDAYGGQYKDRHSGYGEAEKFGTDQIPVKHDQIPAKGLTSVGG